MCAASEGRIEKASLGRVGLEPPLQREGSNGHAHFQRARKPELSQKGCRKAFIPNAPELANGVLVLVCVDTYKAFSIFIMHIVCLSVKVILGVFT